MNKLINNSQCYCRLWLLFDTFAAYPIAELVLISVGKRYASGPAVVQVTSLVYLARHHLSPEPSVVLDVIYSRLILHQLTRVVNQTDYSVLRPFFLQRIVCQVLERIIEGLRL